MAEFNVDVTFWSAPSVLALSLGWNMPDVSLKKHPAIYFEVYRFAVSHVIGI